MAQGNLMKSFTQGMAKGFVAAGEKSKIKKKPEETNISEQSINQDTTPTTPQKKQASTGTGLFKKVATKWDENYNPIEFEKVELTPEEIAASKSGGQQYIQQRGQIEEEKMREGASYKTAQIQAGTQLAAQQEGAINKTQQMQEYKDFIEAQIKAKEGSLLTPSVQKQQDIAKAMLDLQSPEYAIATTDPMTLERGKSSLALGLKWGADAIDWFRTAITRKRPAEIENAIETFNLISKSTDENIKSVATGASDYNEVWRSLVNNEAAILRLETENQRMIKYNLDYFTGGGATIQAQIIVEKAILVRQREDLLKAGVASEMLRLGLS